MKLTVHDNALGCVLPNFVPEGLQPHTSPDSPYIGQVCLKTLLKLIEDNVLSFDTEGFAISSKQVTGISFDDDPAIEAETVRRELHLLALEDQVREEDLRAISEHFPNFVPQPAMQ